METWIIPWLTIIWFRFGLLLLGALTELLLLPLLPVKACGSCWPGGSAICALGGDLAWWCDDRRWWFICCCRKSVSFKGISNRSLTNTLPQNLITIWRCGSLLPRRRPVRMLCHSSSAAGTAGGAADTAIASTTAVGLCAVAPQETVSVSGAVKGLPPIRIRWTPCCGAFLGRRATTPRIFALRLGIAWIAVVVVIVIEVLCETGERNSFGLINIWIWE